MTRSGLPMSVLRQNEPSTFERAERMLAQVATAESALEVMAAAEVARAMAERMKLGTVAINHATSIKLRAERRLADAVDQGQAAGEIPEKGAHTRSAGMTSLSDLGVSTQRLTEARLIRDTFTDEDILAMAEAASARDREIARNRLLREARDDKSKGQKDDKARRTVIALTLPAEADIRFGDFRSVLADVPDGSVDAIITDPPYPAEFLGLFGDLAALADRVLTPDGVLAVMSGQTHLPDVYEQMSGHRPYRWTMAYQTPGAGYASHARRVQSNWKPVIVYGGGPRFGDVLSSDAADKRLHEWGQDLQAFTALVERLTEPTALVCDPFLGGGTTALAALSLGRRFLGCDSDQASVDMTRRRLEEQS